MEYRKIIVAKQRSGAEYIDALKRTGRSVTDRAARALQAASFDRSGGAKENEAPMSDSTEFVLFSVNDMDRADDLYGAIQWMIQNGFVFCPPCVGPELCLAGDPAADRFILESVRTFSVRIMYSLYRRTRARVSCVPGRSGKLERVVLQRLHRHLAVQSFFKKSLHMFLC